MNEVLGVLSVGVGDIKLSFDKANPQERIRAARIVADMLRRGYAILINLPDGTSQRVKEFDEAQCEYIIADLDPLVAEAADKKEAGNGEANETGTAARSGAPVPTAPRRGRPPGPTKRVPAERASGTAIARTSGG